MNIASIGRTSGKATEKWLSDRIVNVFVGPERKKWAVHEKLLTSHSDFFKRALNGFDPKKGPKIGASTKAEAATTTGGGGEDGEAQAEPENENVELPEEDPKLFAMAVRWLYGMTFAGRCEFPPVGTADSDVSVRDYMALYVLAARLGIEGLKNAAINAVYDYYHNQDEFGFGEDGVRRKRRCPDLRDVKYVFENTNEDAQMRRLLVVSTLFFLFGSRENPDTLPAEWEDVLRSNGEIAWELIKMVGSWRWVMGQNCPSMTVKKKCSFHDHVEGSKCDDF